MTDTPPATYAEYSILSVQELIRLLADENEDVHNRAVHALLDKAREKKDISLALPALAECAALDLRYDVNALTAIRAIALATKNNADLTPILPTVLKISVQSCRQGQWADYALANFGIVFIGSCESIAILRAIETRIQGYLHEFRGRKLQIRERHLTRALPPSLERIEILRAAVQLIVRIERIGWGIMGVFGPLEEERGIKSLNVLQQSVESAFREWKPAAGTTDPKLQAYRIRVLQHGACLLKEIARGTALISRMRDGELLAGETISKPERKRGIYQAVRRC